MPKLSKQAGIKIIIAELQKGTAKGSIMAYFGNKWQTPKDTFNKWYLIALAQYNEAQISINKQKAEDYRQNFIKSDEQKKKIKKAKQSKFLILYYGKTNMGNEEGKS